MTARTGARHIGTGVLALMLIGLVTQGDNRCALRAVFHDPTFCENTARIFDDVLGCTRIKLEADTRVRPHLHGRSVTE